MSFDADLEPAPHEFRDLFSGQALSHLDELVLSWRTGGHPITWTTTFAKFQVHLLDGPAPLFSLHAPFEGFPARIEVDVSEASKMGFPSDLTQKLWEELADIGKVVDNPNVPLRVSLGKFSRGDRKVFLAYALTIARYLARPPKDP